MAPTTPCSLINFKTENKQRLLDEFHSDLMDRRLRLLIYAVSAYCWETFHKPILITEILRSPDEQREIYKNDPAYQQQPWLSVHEYWRAADLRTLAFTSGEIINLVGWLNDMIEYDKGNHPTLLYHEVSEHGLHLHLQVDQSNVLTMKYHSADPV